LLILISPLSPQPDATSLLTQTKLSLSYFEKALLGVPVTFAVGEI